MRAWAVVVAILAGCAGPEPVAGDDPLPPAESLQEPRVVVATFDTGTNPFHPCWQRNGTDVASAIPEIAGQVKPLYLTFADTYEDSLDASEEALESIEDHTLYHINGTRLLFYGSNGAKDELVDVYPHGAQASSQIACAEHGMAPDAWLVIVNWYDADRVAAMQWAAQQPWIDVVHLNIQRIMPSLPASTAERAAIAEMADTGQYVVLANGNGFQNAVGHIPSETIDFNSIHGTHLAGSSDGSGYTYYSNPDPHTVMDGCGTVAAAPDSFETRTFGGTSSASPRTTGYVAQLLLELRMALNVTQGAQDGALIQINQTLPGGPLADGRLDRLELHEVVRKTADPGLGASRWDEGTCGASLPRYLPADGADYHRVGYGKLTEDTLPVALEVLVGARPMPERETADRFYEVSTTIRDAYWSQAS